MQKDNSYEEVIMRNSDMVYRLAFSLVKSKADADDIYQEVFMRYVKAGQEFDSEDHEKAWFIRVTVNCCKNFWKSPWVQRRTAFWEESISQSGEFTGWADDTTSDSGFVSGGTEYETENTGFVFRETEAASDSDEQYLIEVVKQLPEKYRVVIHLFYYEEMSIEEIAQITGLKASTVRTRLTRARRRLKEKLGGI